MKLDGPIGTAKYVQYYLETTMGEEASHPSFLLIGLDMLGEWQYFVMGALTASHVLIWLMLCCTQQVIYSQLAFDWCEHAARKLRKNDNAERKSDLPKVSLNQRQ